MLTPRAFIVIQEFPGRFKKIKTSQRKNGRGRFAQRESVSMRRYGTYKPIVTCVCLVSDSVKRLRKGLKWTPALLHLWTTASWLLLLAVQGARVISLGGDKKELHSRSWTSTLTATTRWCTRTRYLCYIDMCKFQGNLKCMYRWHFISI